MVFLSVGTGMMSPSSHHTAARVARRFRSAVVVRDKRFEVVLADGGVVTTRDMEHLLEHRVGFVTRLRFRAALAGAPNVVRWEGLDGRGQVVSGTLVLHAGVRADRVVAWAEVVVEDGGVMVPF
ncbi:MAG: hypothetical protein HYZ29_11775 [Myxococcales bacterium]|nr:hypothetical protein [Myxococcales bacterium]